MGTNKKSHQRAPRSSSMTLAPIQMAQKAPQSLMQSRQRFVLQAAKRSAISVCRCSQRRTQGRHNSGSGVRRHGNFINNAGILAAVAISKMEDSQCTLSSRYTSKATTAAPVLLLSTYANTIELAGRSSTSHTPQASMATLNKPTMARPKRGSLGSLGYEH